MPIIAPSLLSADYLNLQRDCDMLNKSEADWFHLDVMDGRFVPNISFGPMLVEFFRKSTNKVCDVHLMIEQPERYLEAFAQAGARVAIHSHRQKDAAEQVKASLSGSGHILVQADIADPRAVARMVDETIAGMGHIDILVNNAGITRDAMFHKMSFEQWSAVLRTNLDSMFAMTRPVIDGMRELRLLRGSTDEILERKLYRRYYPHQTSHWLGLDVHDPGDYARAGESRALEPGMVFTVEPWYYNHDLGIAVFVEDVVLVTEDGAELLTAALPRTPEELEAMIR